MRRIIEHAEEGLLVFLMGVMTMVAFINVITRYLIRYSLAFTEELVVSLFVWLTLLGTSIAFRQGTHLGFSFIVDRSPRPVQRAAIWLAAGLGVVLFGFLIYFGLGQIRSERMLGTTSEALAIPQWWYTAGIPVIGVLIIARILEGAILADRRVRG
ncbi:MAG TPA: TRAP transporter small permease [Candidatus Methylomirabilis sp.]|nr:TRAP transporter small permease [Candidatus Methylomirabilis sp.]